MSARSTLHDAMLARAQAARHGRGGVELDVVTLAIGHRQRVALQALLARQREHRGGIESARKQDDGASCSSLFPGTLPHSTLCSWSWKRTGSRSARIQSASSRAGSCSALGENSTVQRCGEFELRDFRAAPLVVGAIADHELDLLLRAQQRELLVAIAALLAASPASSRRPRGSRAHPRRPAAWRRWSRATRDSRHRKAR